MEQGGYNVKGRPCLDKLCVGTVPSDAHPSRRYCGGRHPSGGGRCTNRGVVLAVDAAEFAEKFRRVLLLRLEKAGADMSEGELNQFSMAAQRAGLLGDTGSVLSGEEVSQRIAGVVERLIAPVERPEIREAVEAGPVVS